MHFFREGSVPSRILLTLGGTALETYGKIARIHLNKGTVQVETVEEALARDWIGGRGLGTRLLLDNPSPEKRMAFFTGPMTGATAPAAGRYVLLAESPVTGRLTCASSGGIWGAKLKAAGWAGLIVEGTAPEWTYLSVEEGEIRLHSALGLRDALTGAVVERLQSLHGLDASVLSIGPAGENAVSMAAIANDGIRAAGRSGLGAVMGALHLKAIVVRASHWAGHEASGCQSCGLVCGHGSREKAGEWNDLCDAYGLDAVSAGETVAAARELYRQGWFPEEVPQTPEAWAKRLSHPQTALDRAMCTGAAGLYACCGLPEPAHEPKRKKTNQSRALQAVVDSLGMCLFSASVLDLEAYTALVNSALGTVYSPEAVLSIGQRICEMG